MVHWAEPTGLIASSSSSSYVALDRVPVRSGKKARRLKQKSTLTRKSLTAAKPSFSHVHCTFLPPMDSEENKSLSECTQKTRQLFLDFLTRITKLDEFVAVGSRLLVGFRRELEFLRREPLHKTSKVVEGIIEANMTERMKIYLEAGCRHVHTSVQNINKLNSCQQGLQDNLNKVKLLLDEVEHLTDDAFRIVQSVYENNDCLVLQSSFEKKEADSSLLRCIKISDYGVMMRIILNMFKLDLAMQEKIVLSLNYNSSSSQLESYCVMWDLRPFIDEKVMHQAWRFIS